MKARSVYHIDKFILIPERERYPNNLFKAIYLKKYYPHLLKNPDIKDFIEKAMEDYKNRYNVDTSGLPDYLFPYQKKDLAFALKLKKAAIFWEQGMGKTVLAVEWLKRVPKPVLVVTRKRIIPNWIEHLERFAPGLTYTVIEGKKIKPAEVYLVNYEKLHFVRFKPRSLILDESHAVKSTKAKRTKQCIELAKSAKYVLLLSGTPVTRTPEDIYTQMKILWPLMFVNKEEFRKDFVVLDRTGTYPISFKNLDKLMKRILAVSVVRKKENHLDLPAKLEETIYVELSPEQEEVSTALQTGFKWSGIEVSNYLALYQKLHQVSAGFIYDNNKNTIYLRSEKTERLREMLQEIDEQVIVWFLFKAEGNRLEEEVKSIGLTYSKVDSNTKNPDIEVEKFRRGKTDVLLANILSLSEGINLQNCPLAIYHSLPWSYKDFAQSIDRIHRPGQKKTSRFVYLVSKDFIDVEILKSLSRKKDYTPAELQKKIAS